MTNFTIHVILTRQDYNDAGEVRKADILFEEEVNGLEDEYVNYDIALAAFKKVQKYDRSDPNKPNPINCEVKVVEPEVSEFHQKCLDASPINLLGITCDMFIEVTSDILRDELADKSSDLDDIHNYVHQMDMGINIYQKVQKCVLAKTLELTLAETSFLSFMAGQIVCLCDEDETLDKKFRKFNVDPSW